MESIEFEKPIAEYMNILSGLHTDVILNMIRCELKAGKQTYQNSLAKEGTGMFSAKLMERGLEGIPDRLKAKMTIMKSKTTKQVRENATSLQTTLQNAGQLEPPRPKIFQYEQTLIQEGNKNPYFNALLYMSLAGNKPTLPEQKYLLEQALNFIDKAQEEEGLHAANAVHNSVFLFSTLLDDISINKKAHDFYPFNYLYDKDYIQETKIPPKPILISKTSGSITMKLPPFNPLIPPLQLLENENLNKVKTMAIYGKVSANGVDVSLTSNDFPNTGTRMNNGSIVTITNLTPNEKYCFAVAGFDPDEQVIKGIGKTGEDVLTAYPLPINLLYCYLAKISYQIGDFETSERAAERACNFFMERTDVKDRNLDNTSNPIYLFRITQKALKNYSLHEIAMTAEAFVVMARCLERKYADIEANTKVSLVPITIQRNHLRICNYLVMALELSTAAKFFIMSKKIAKEIYNQFQEFLKFKTKSPFIYQILVKTQLVLSQIPKEIWDTAIRHVSAKISYELIKVTFQINEIRLSKLILYQDLKTPLRKWFMVMRTEMVPEEIPQLKDDKKKAIVDTKKAGKATKKGDKKEEEKKEEEEKEEPPKLVPKIVRDVLEKPSIQFEFEETLLSMSEEYSDAVYHFIEQWKETLEFYKPFIENGNSIIDEKKSTLSVKFDFWEMLRLDLNNAFTKIQASYKQHPAYIEFCSKVLKRLLERNVDKNQIIGFCNQVTEPDSETLKLVNEIEVLRKKALESDIGWNPKLLEDLVHEREINKEGDDKAIELFTVFWQKDGRLQELVNKNPAAFRYEQEWLSDFYFIKAIAMYLNLQEQTKKVYENYYEVYFDVAEMELDRVAKAESELIEDREYGNKHTEDQIAKLTEIFGYLAKASSHAERAKALYQIQNIGKFALNILKTEMLTPWGHKNTPLGQSIGLISQNLVLTLYEAKEKVEKENHIPGRHQMLTMEETKMDSSKGSDPTSYSNYLLLSTVLKKEFWFMVEWLDVRTIADLTAYAIQSFIVEERYNALVELSKHFCNVTTHFYSGYVLPFTVYSQGIIHDRAHKTTEKRREALAERTNKFEVWKAQNKKKRTRQAALTEVIPPEQIEFERDEAELKRQIDVSQRKENFLREDMERSENVYKQIKRDENQVLDLLNQCRKLLAQRGEGIKRVNYEGQSSIGDIRAKKRNEEVFTHTLILKYGKVIAQLKEKQLNAALVQALNELGNLNYSIDNIALAEENWIDSLDTIFQKFGILKSWRSIREKYKNLGFDIGVQQCLIGAVLLYKLAHLVYYKNQHLHSEAILMASELVFAIFKINLPHTLIAVSYGDYRVKEIFNSEKVFEDKYALDPTEAMLALDYITMNLIDMNKHVNALPCAALIEYLADITK